MAAYKMVLAYCGTGFCGWQTQKKNKPPAVQEVLEKELSRLMDEDVSILGAGRTDAGVHALGQVVHFKTETVRRPAKMREGLNSLLPATIRVLSVDKTAAGFHPRYQAQEKTYRYLIQNQPAANPLLLPYSYFFPKRLNLNRMKQAAALLTGHHDFAAFQGSGRKAGNTVRTISKLKVALLSDTLFHTERLVAITITGNGYLYRMARNITGTLIEVGRGKMNPAEVARILHSRNRVRAGPTAPACGLTLMRVSY